MKALHHIAIGCLLAGSLVLPDAGRAATPLPDDKALYSAVFAAADDGRWQLADALAAKGSYPSLLKLLTWMRLSQAQILPGFDELAAFITANPVWPGMNTLRRRAEVAMSDAMNADQVFEWFAAHPPLSRVGKMRLAEAHRAKGDNDAAADLLRDAWINSDFSRAEEKTFYRRYHDDWLTIEDHDARLDRLLWDGKCASARRMLRRATPGQRALGEARMALRAFSGGVDGAISRVPDELRNHPGLWYERLRWRRRKGFHDSAREILSSPPSDLTRPALWWREANFQARKAIQSGLISMAYTYAADHGQTEALPRSEAEWLAGWIALRFLDDPKIAFPHFTTLYDGVRYPISLSRGAYWSGRAATNDPGLAKKWFETASRYPTTFYGQLALAEIDGQSSFNLPPDPTVSNADREAMESLELTQITQALAVVGPGYLLRPFVRRLIDSAATPGQKKLVSAIAREAERPEVGVLAARRAARSGTILIEYGYPMIRFPAQRDGERQVDEALLLSMLRQESGFAGSARSSAGALGFMQIMPATAKVVARRIGLDYDKERLTNDGAYNLSLGRAFMAELLEKYGGSYALALAAYNGGARRVRFWIKTYGDPRKGEIDVIDWIELIPITETRNYVQRVMEAVAIYRQRLGRSIPADSLRLDLNRGLG